MGRPRIIRVPFKCIKNLFETQFCLNTKDVGPSDVIHPVPIGALAHAAFMKEAQMMFFMGEFSYSIASFSPLLCVIANELHDSD